MNFVGTLIDTLKDYVVITEGKPSIIGYLSYSPGRDKWGWFNGGDINQVWAVLNDPTIVNVLRLEPAATLNALAVDPVDKFVIALTRYATFVASRPSHTGLHHFIDVAPPEQITEQNAARDGEARA